MKKSRTLFFIFFFFCTSTYGQTIQYSRQAFKTPDADAMQLVANISGYHHLLCFSAGKPPAIYIFDAQLQLKEEKKLAFKLQENCDIRLLPFTGFYFLYVHTPGTTVHEVWKINGEGDAVSLSASFQAIIDSGLNKSKATLQLVNRNEELFVVAHTYYDAIKKMGTTIVQLDKEVRPVHTRKVLYDFNKDEETLQQAALAGNSLYLLKTVRNNEAGNSLDVAKINLTTGGAIQNSFNSGSHLYNNPAFTYNAADSTVLLYSMVQEPPGSTRSQRTVFISRLDHLLQEQVPVTLLKSQFRNNTAANFLLLEGQTPCWLTMNNSLRIIRRLNSGANGFRNFEDDDMPGLNLRRTTTSYPAYFSDYNGPAGVRFTVLNDRFRLLKDSLVANNQNIYDIQPRPFAQFAMNNKAYLVLIQNFSSKHRGLLMVNTSGQGGLETSDIRVFDRYNYQLAQLQAVGNSYFILPYTYKKEVGLVKIKMD